jgi:hypothetical protein
MPVPAIIMGALAAVQLGVGIYNTAKANKQAKELRENLKDSETPPEFGSVATRARQRADSMGEYDRTARERQLENARLNAMSQIDASSGSPSSKMAASIGLNRSIADVTSESSIQNIREREALHRYADQLSLTKAQADLGTEDRNFRKTMVEFGMVDRQMEAGSQAIEAGLSNAMGAAYYGGKLAKGNKVGKITGEGNVDNTGQKLTEGLKIGGTSFSDKAFGTERANIAGISGEAGIKDYFRQKQEEQFKNSGNFNVPYDEYEERNRTRRSFAEQLRKERVNEETDKQIIENENLAKETSLPTSATEFAKKAELQQQLNELQNMYTSSDTTEKDFLEKINELMDKYPDNEYLKSIMSEYKAGRKTFK